MVAFLDKALVNSEFDTHDGVSLLSASGAEDEATINRDMSQALWRAVILQAFADACSHSQRTEATVERQRARSWLSGGGEDFNTVCALAGYEADYVRRKALAAISSGALMYDLVRAEISSARKGGRKAMGAQQAVLAASASNGNEAVGQEAYEKPTAYAPAPLVEKKSLAPFLLSCLSGFKAAHA